MPTMIVCVSTHMRYEYLSLDLTNQVGATAALIHAMRRVSPQKYWRARVEGIVMSIPTVFIIRRGPPEAPKPVWWFFAGYGGKKLACRNVYAYTQSIYREMVRVAGEHDVPTGAEDLIAFLAADQAARRVAA